MYEFISGELIRKQADHAIILTAGVGYKLKVSFSTYEQLPLLGESVRLYSYLHVREDIFELYGFSTELEREFFFKLISISKVGPKAALAILSAGSPADITNWILSEDAKSISKTPGIGPTTAKRIILELKGKLAKGLGLPDTLAGEAGDSATARLENEALLALEALGYNRADVFSKIRKIMSGDDKPESSEKLIKRVLHQPR